jgi:hypothetical protein
MPGIELVLYLPAARPPSPSITDRALLAYGTAHARVLASMGLSLKSRGVATPPTGSAIR